MYRINNKLGPLKVLNNHLVIYPTPLNLNYMYSWGSMAGIVLTVQIVTGILLAMHYTPHVDHAFASVIHLMQDVPNGIIMRYTHANGASLFFVVVYMHIFRGMYYSSGNQPRELVWITGVVILLLMIITAFIGYVLPWGQMSFWGATVITSLATVIPVVGKNIVHWLWGGFPYSYVFFTEATYYSNVIMIILLDAGTSFMHISTKNAKLWYYFMSIMLQNKVKKYSYNSFISRFMNNKSQRLNAEDLMWFVGFFEGDGSFSVNKNGKYVKYEMAIELSVNDIQLLYKIKTILGGYGSITTRKRKNPSGEIVETSRLKISSKPILVEHILPIFNQYAMLTSKYYDYLYFRECLLKNIVYFDELPSYERPNQTPYSLIKEILALPYFDNWLIGFIEAEGSFCFYNVTGETYMTASFGISQKNGLQIITVIKKKLGLNSNPFLNKKTDCYSINTTSSRGIQNVINFLKHTTVKLKGNKKAQYLSWLHHIRKNYKYAQVKIPFNY
jgi:ubiquinol-cytochrome c reductase cytochrome b subunit